jgi:bla regulator protein blaR1
LPSFEVVSIRPWKPVPSPPPPPPTPADGTTTVPRNERFAPGRGGGPKTDHMRITLPTELLVTFAYGLPLGFENRVIGRTDWMGSDQYEILAKIEESQFAAMQKMTPAEQRGQVALMEQSLLSDRFKLKVHFETREMPVYALTVAKGGPKLTPAKDGEATRLSVIDIEQGLQMTAVSVTLEQWIESPFLGGRTVVDQTGLKGAYDFTLTWGRPQPETSDAGPGAAPLIVTAIQEQLGLKLVPTKAPVEVIVIDHIERPSEN